MTNKNLHEEFTQFFEKPTREGLRNLLKSNYGERDHLDFKAEWPAFPKLARHILAMANSGGGCMVIGVGEKPDGAMEAVGLAKLTDKADISKSLSSLLPSRLKYGVLDFTFEASEYPALIGKRFQVVIVEDDPDSIPFVSQGDGGDGIRKNAIYARKGTASEEADDSQLQQIINRRLATGHSTASEMAICRHLDELAALYSHAPTPSFVDDDRLDEEEQIIRRLIRDKLLLIRDEMGISEPDMVGLRHKAGL